MHLDTVRDLPLRDIATIHHDPEKPLPLRSFCAELARVDDDFITTFLDTLGPGSDSPFVESELRHLGGAAARDVPETSAVGGRSGRLMLRLVVEEPSAFDAASSVAADVFAAAAQFRSDATNVNFAGSMANREAFENAWPEAIGRRLGQVRGEQDPNRLFPFGPK